MQFSYTIKFRRSSKYKEDFGSYVTSITSKGQNKYGVGSCSKETLEDCSSVFGKEINDYFIDVFIAAGNLFPERLLDLVFFAAIRSPIIVILK